MPLHPLPLAPRLPRPVPAQVCFWFFLSLFFVPVISAIPPYGTGPALMLVGALMMENLLDINWLDVTVRWRDKGSGRKGGGRVTPVGSVAKSRASATVSVVQGLGARLDGGGEGLVRGACQSKRG